MAPSTLGVLLALGIYGMGYSADHVMPFMKFLMTFTYFRFGLVGISAALFNDREPLRCNEIYCHYRNPEVFLMDVGIVGGTPQHEIVIVILYCIFFRVVAYFALTYSINSELKSKLVHFVVQTVKKTK